MVADGFAACGFAANPCSAARRGNNVSMRHFVSIVFCTTILALGGCATYEFSIVQPTENAMLITKQERTVTLGPVVYYFVDQSSRLGIRIENPTDAPLTIKGEESYVVTPNGRSEPLRGGTIAPGTWSAVTIPPVERVYSGGGSGVSFGIGVGTWGSHGGGGVGIGTGPYDPFYGDGLYSSRDVAVWQWKEGLVQLHLVYEPKDDKAERFEQDFTFQRRKVSK